MPLDMVLLNTDATLHRAVVSGRDAGVQARNGAQIVRFDQETTNEPPSVTR